MFLTSSTSSYCYDLMKTLCAERILIQYVSECGSGSLVGITTGYELDGPGSNPGGDEIFRPSRPTLGPTQLPVKWVLGLSRVQSAVRACC